MQTAIALDEGLKAVIPLGSHIDENYEKYDNKLVHLSGKLQTNMVRTRTLNSGMSRNYAKGRGKLGT